MGANTDLSVTRASHAALVDVCTANDEELPRNTARC